jgi:hypothetical protein
VTTDASSPDPRPEGNGAPCERLGDRDESKRTLLSVVADAVGAQIEREIPPRTVASYTYWRGLPTDGGEVHQKERRAVGLWPTNDGLTLSYVAWPIDEFEAFRADIEGNHTATLAAMGDLGDRVHAAERPNGSGPRPTCRTSFAHRMVRGGRSSATRAGDGPDHGPGIGTRSATPSSRPRRSPRGSEA